MIPFDIYGKVFLMPESWNELSRKQFVAISKVMMKETLEDVDKANLWRICSGMSWWYFLQLNFLPAWLNEKMFWKKVETMLFVARQLHWIDFLFKEISLTGQLLPSIKVGWRKKLYGPERNFENLRMEEFCFSEHYYLKYKQSSSVEDLRMFVASIYRPAKKDYDIWLNADGDTRVPFNEHLITHYAKQLKSVPVHVLFAIVIWYEGCRLSLTNTFDRVFNGEESETESFGLFSLITNVAEDGVMGNYDLLLQKQVHVVLLRLTELLIKAEALEAEIKNQQSK